MGTSVSLSVPSEDRLSLPSVIRASCSVRRRPKDCRQCCVSNSRFISKNMVSNCARSGCDCDTNSLLLQIRDCKCLEHLDLAVSNTSNGAGGREVPLHQVITVSDCIL